MARLAEKEELLAPIVFEPGSAIVAQGNYFTALSTEMKRTGEIGPHAPAKQG